MAKVSHVIWAGVGLISFAATLMYVAISEKLEPNLRNSTVAVSLTPPPVEQLSLSHVADQTDLQESLPSPTQQSTPPVNPPPVVDPEREATERLDTAISWQTADYSLSFRPGVFLDESIPEFVVTFDRANKPNGDDIVAEYTRHLQSPVDAWSLEMESRLRGFFESQPEISVARAVISCRAPQCVVQIVRPSSSEVSPGLAQQFLNLLRQEAWFNENLRRGSTRGIFGQFRHEMLTFVRRPPLAK
jgi:hypothetical protein